MTNRAKGIAPTGGHSVRNGAVIVAVALVVGTAAYVWWIGDRRDSDGTGSAIVRRDLKVVQLPDLTRLDRDVQQQVRDRHAALTATLANDRSSDAELAEAFGSFGKLLLATEYPMEAEVSFLNSQALAPTDMRWPYYRGHAYRAQQEPARAIPMFERALALAPDDVPSLIWLSELHLVTGNPRAAEPYLQRAIMRQPDSPAAVSRLGRVALAVRDFPKAIEYLERALQLKPDAASVHYPLGMAYRGAGEMARAEVHLKHAGDSGFIAPADPLMDAVTGLLQSAGAFEARGMEALEARDWKLAVENLREAVRRSPQNAVTRLNLGTALSLAGNGPAARHELLEAVRLSPQLAKAHFALALLSQDEGRWDDAVERLSRAVEHEPTFVDAQFALAEALRRTGRAEQSLSHYHQVLQLNDAASQARFGLAMALVQLRRYADARRALAEAVQLHPDQPGFPHALARILAAAPDAAARDGRQALALMQPLVATGQPGAAVSETLAMVLAELGRFDDAVTWQERAIAEARREGRPGVAERMQDNLVLYRRREPCRTPWRDDDPVIAVVK